MSEKEYAGYKYMLSLERTYFEEDENFVLDKNMLEKYECYRRWNKFHMDHVYYDETVRTIYDSCIAYYTFAPKTTSWNRMYSDH